MTTTGEMEKKIESILDLPSLPSILKHLIEVFQDEDSSFLDISNIIRYDQSLAEKILRIANSPYFGHSGSVNNLEQAVMLLGYDMVKSICLGASFFHYSSPGHRKLLEGLWRHSYEVGVIASGLAGQAGSVDRSISFTAGLLHDIGRVLFLIIEKDHYMEMIISPSILNDETDAFGMDHGMAGAIFLEKAYFPREITMSIKYHHRPSLLGSCEESAQREISSVIALAEALSRNFFPKPEDDGIWTEEHDAIMLELAVDSKKVEDLRMKAEEETGQMESMLFA